MACTVKEPRLLRASKRRGRCTYVCMWSTTEIADSGGSKSKDVAHLIAARRFANQPASSSESSIREQPTVLRAMSELNPLIFADKVNGVLADNVTTSNCLNPNLSVRSRANLSVTTVTADIGGELIAAPSNSLCKGQGGARGCIEFSLVVKLDDLGVVTRAERAGGDFNYRV